MKAPPGIAGSFAAALPGATVAAGIVALSLAPDDGVAIGLGSAAVWVAIVIVALARRSPERIVPLPLLIGGTALGVLTLISALSLGWSPDRGAGFTDVVRMSGYLGVFVLAGMLLGPGSARSVLTGIAVGLVAVSSIAVASRLLGVGAGDAELVASFPSSSGRLSYPIGYWNALGAMAAMAVPVLVWLGAAIRDPRLIGLVLVGFVPSLLAAHMTSSRGALIAAAIGVVVAIAANPHRGRALAASLVGVVAAVPAVICATLGTGILDSPWSGFGEAEAFVCAAIVLGVIFAAGVGPSVVAGLGRARFARLRMNRLLVAAAVLMVGVIVVVGPGEVAGDFASTSGREAIGSGTEGFSVAGSGRAQFWSAALEAFASDPIRGIGAGGFPSYWNRNGGLETPVQNAHSEPLELLAELGLLGMIAIGALLGTALVVGVRRTRGVDGPPAGACLGLLATGLVGVMIDWTWDIPAVMLPLLLSTALICGRSLDVRVPSRGSSASRKAGSLLVPAPAIALVAAAFAIPAIWAGGVLAAATDRLRLSEAALSAGQLTTAAQAARSAAAIEPWSPEPWLQLATIEQAADNLEAARRATVRSIELAPDDFRSWIFAAIIERELGNDETYGSYAMRAVTLAPLVLSRAAIDPRLGFSSGQ